MPTKHAIYTYKFEELAEGPQQLAIENNYDINVYYGWWDGVYEDAERAGLEITGFDVGMRDDIDYSPAMAMGESIEAIRAEHGKNCDTYKLTLEDWEDEERYFRQLAEEYLTSDEAIRETLIINGYEFTENGKIYSRRPNK
jgi:hypothetical protein